MVDKTEKNPKRLETEVPESLTKSWLLAHGYEKEDLKKIECTERAQTLNPVKRAVKK